MKRVEHLTIVGGGSAGWLCAAYFARRSNLTKASPQMAWGDKLKVTIIDKEVPDRIGVGEATILAFGRFMGEMGFDDDYWQEKVDAIHKGAIVFEGWTTPEHEMWHPFGFTDITYNINEAGNYDVAPLWDVWSVYKDKFDLKETQALYTTALANRIEPNNMNVYANHLDAGKLAEFLKEESITHPCLTHIESDVTEVHWHDNGEVDYLKLKDGREHRSDLYVDCTGFKRLLSRDPKKDMVDLSDRLFTNTAIAGPIQYQNRDVEMHPWTHAKTVDCGWIWVTPIISRIGSGLVFNRNITDPDHAKDVFVDYWDNRIKKEDLRTLNWDPVKAKNGWVGNVVSIGLSAGFIEPLESTGLALIVRAIETLEENIRGDWYDENEIALFNARVNGAYENSIDFVNMHYGFTQRTEPFWQHVRDTYQKSEIYKFWEAQMKDPDHTTRQTQKFGFFGGHNFAVCMAQWNPDLCVRKNYFDKYSDQLEKNMQHFYNQLQENIDLSVPLKEKLPWLKE